MQDISKYLNYKYLRIQGLELASQTNYAKGVFSLCWNLVQKNLMEEEDADLYREIDSWIAEALPYPPQCNNRERVVCFFKTENVKEMLRRIRPALWLLDRYEVPYFMVLTNTPGKIIYEDEYQVVVEVDGKIHIDTEQESWT